ncbi:hypothetical protein T265_12267 [Opisthorchis viverrini]|uniref:Uncharacterized protein n=1 Tax=Opisthorchis viverrini TaxID=6198 RepID=A0A074ZT82_OPIVI|nr:hypothetical protein T265_12267 [Opisthorchis viverrini]KER18469.1 hypothetical protein T265_12267 [Opisthorchis viverrini]
MTLQCNKRTVLFESFSVIVVCRCTPGPVRYISPTQLRKHASPAVKKSQLNTTPKTLALKSTPGKSGSKRPLPEESDSEEENHELFPQNGFLKSKVTYSFIRSHIVLYILSERSS